MVQDLTTSPKIMREPEFVNAKCSQRVQSHNKLVKKTSNQHTVATSREHSTLLPNMTIQQLNKNRQAIRRSRQKYLREKKDYKDKLSMSRLPAFNHHTNQTHRDQDLVNKYQLTTNSIDDKDYYSKSNGSG